MTGLSRVFGLLRDVVIGVMFGPGAGVDAFIVAFRIPNFLRRLFAEGGFSQAFVPILSEYKAQRGEDEVKALLDQTSATLGLVLLLVSITGVIAAPILILIFAPGFTEQSDQKAMAVAMLRITFPYIFFISLTAMAGGIRRPGPYPGVLKPVADCLCYLAGARVCTADIGTGLGGADCGTCAAAVPVAFFAAPGFIAAAPP